MPRRNCVFKYATCWVTIISFFLSLMDPPAPVFAQGPLHNALLTDKYHLASGNSLLKLNVPEQWGEEIKNFQGQKDQTVIFIQDLHGNIRAQKNIVRLLRRLADAGINTLGVEGASGNVDIRAVRNIMQKSLREKIAGFFLKRGYFCGAEYLVSTDLKHPWNLYGLEDKSLYLQNLHQYRDQIRDFEKIKLLIGKVEEKWKFLEKKFFNQRLYHFVCRLKDKEEDVEKIVQFLSKQAGKYGFKPGNQIRLKIRQMAIEKNIQIKNVYEERNQLIQEMSKTWAREEGQELVKHALSYRTGEATSYQFYTWLKKECREKKVSLKKYKHLAKYIRVVEFEIKMNEDILYEEIQNLSDQLAARLSLNSRESEMMKKEKSWKLLKNLLLGELSRQELKSISGQKDLSGNLRKYFEEISFEVVDEKEWNDFLLKEEEARNFYETVLARDESLLKGILHIVNDKKINHLAVVSGGFHTEGIVHELEKQNISYRVILPHGDVGQNDDLYIGQILGHTRAVDELTGRRGIRLNAALKLANPANLDGELSDQARDFYEALYALMMALGADWSNAVEGDMRAIAVSLKSQLETCFPGGMLVSVEERNGRPGVAFGRDASGEWKSFDDIRSQWVSDAESKKRFQPVPEIHIEEMRSSIAAAEREAQRAGTPVSRGERLLSIQNQSFVIALDQRHPFRRVLQRLFDDADSDASLLGEIINAEAELSNPEKILLFLAVEPGQGSTSEALYVHVKGKEAESKFRSAGFTARARTVKELIAEIRRKAEEIPISILINGKDAELNMDMKQELSVEDRIEIVSPDNVGLYAESSGLPFAIYAGDTLRVSHLKELRVVWENAVREHLNLIFLGQKIGRYAPQDIPEIQLRSVYDMVDFRSKSINEIRYLLGFILYNAEYIGAKPEFLARYLSLIVAGQLSGIPARDFARGISTFPDLSFFKIDEIAEYRYPGKSYYHWESSRVNLEQQVRRLSGWEKPQQDQFLERMEALVTEILPSAKLGLHNLAFEKYGTAHPGVLCVLPEYLPKVEEIISRMPLSEINAEAVSEATPDPRAERVFQRSTKSDAPVLTNEGDQKVRSFELTDGTVLYLKRVNIMRVRYPEEEIDIAQRIGEHLKQQGSMASALKFIGAVYARGSFYVISLGIAGERLSERLMPAHGSPALRALQDIVGELKQEGVWHADDMAREKDILVSQNPQGDVHYTVIDLETMPYTSLHRMKAASASADARTTLTTSDLSTLTTTVVELEKDAARRGAMVSREDRLLSVWEHDLVQSLASMHPFRMALNELIQRYSEDAELLGIFVRDAPGLSEEERNFLVFAIEPGQGGGHHEAIQILRQQIRKAVPRFASGTPNNQETIALMKLDDPNASSVQQVLHFVKPALSIPEAQKIAEALTAFRNRRKEVKRPLIIGPSELSIPVADTSLETIPLLISEIRSIGNTLLRNEKRSLRLLIELSRRINPKFVSSLDETQMDAPDYNALGVLVPELDTQVFRPLNQLCSLHILTDRVEIYHGRVHPESWRKIPYLGRDLWTAEIDWLSDDGNAHGIALQNCAFVVPGISRNRAGFVYDRLGLLGVESPFTYIDLKSRLVKSGVSKEDYAELFGVERVRQEEIYHAKDHVFTSLRLDKPLGRVTPGDVAEALLKASNESFIRRDLWEHEDVSSPRERRLLSLGIVELSGHLAGLMHEMNEFLRKGKQDLAYAAFLDFMGSQRIIKIMDVGHGYGLAYKVVTDLLEAELGLEGIHNDAELMEYCESGDQKPGRKAYDLIRKIYSRNFWTDSERERLLEERGQGKAGSISQGTKAFREFERRRDAGEYEKAKDERLTQKYRDLLHGNEIYVIDAIVSPKKLKADSDDFFLGYHDKDNKRVYLTREVLKVLERREPGKSIDPKKLEHEYVLHEANEDRSKGAGYHYQLIEDQQGEFPEHYQARGYWEHDGKFYDATGQGIATLALFRLNPEHIIREKQLKLGKGVLGDRLRLVIDALSGPFDSFNDALAKYVQVYGSPNHEELEVLQAMRDHLPEDWVKAHGVKDFLEMGKAAKTKRAELFKKLEPFKREYLRKMRSYGSPAEFDFFWSGIKKLCVASQDMAPQLLEHGLLRLVERFKQEIVVDWPDLVELGVLTGPHASYLFDDGMREIFPYWRKHKGSLMRMVKATGQADELFAAVSELSPVFRNIDFDSVIPNLADIAEDSHGQALKLFKETFPRLEGRYGMEFTKRWRQFYVLTRLTGERSPQFFTQTLPLLESIFNVVSGETAEHVNVLDLLTSIFRKTKNGNRINAALSVIELVNALNEEKKWIEHHYDYVRQGLLDISELKQTSDAEDKIIEGLKVLLHDVRTENGRIRRGEIPPNIYLGGARKKVAGQNMALTSGEIQTLVEFARTASYSEEIATQIEKTGIVYRVIEYDLEKSGNEAAGILKRFAGACHVPGPHGVSFVFVQESLTAQEKEDAKDHEIFEIFWERKLRLELDRTRRQGSTPIFETYRFDLSRAVHVLASAHLIMARGWRSALNSSFLTQELASMTDDELNRIIREDRRDHRLLISYYFHILFEGINLHRIAEISAFEETVKSEAQRILGERIVVEPGARKPITESDVKLSADEWDEVLDYARGASTETRTSSDGAFTYQLVEYDLHESMGPLLKEIGEAFHFRDVRKGITYVLLKKGLRDRAHAIEHEELEMKWQRNLAGKDTFGFSRRKAAHILAWAEQIQMRGWKNSQESAFLESQMRAMSIPQLEKMMGEGRSYHAGLIKQYLPEALESVQTFEDSFKKSAHEQVYDKVWHHLRLGLPLPELLKLESLTVLEALKDIVFMKDLLPGSIVEEVRSALIPIFIRTTDLGLIQMGLSAQDLKNIDGEFTEFFSDSSEAEIFRKMYFLEALRPDRSQKCTEAEALLRRFMQDADAGVRRKAVEVLGSYLFDSHLHAALVQSKENHALSIYYFPQAETIRLLMALMNDADESIKLQASKIVQSLLHVDHFYVSNAIGLNALTGLHDVPWQYYQEIFLPMLTVPDTDQVRETELVQIQRNIAFNLFSEMVNARDIQGHVLLARQDVRPLLDRLIHLLDDPNPYFARALELYADIEVSHRLDKVLECLERNFSRTRSVAQRSQIVKSVGKIAEWNVLGNSSRLLRILDVWLRQFIVPAELRPAQNEEVHLLETKSGSVELRWKDAQSPEVVEIAGYFPGALQVGNDISIQNGLLAGLPVKITVVSFDPKGETYSILCNVFYDDIKIVIELKVSQILPIFELMLGRPASFEGSVTALSLDGYEDLVLGDRVRIVRPDQRLMQQAVSHVDVLKDENAPSLLMGLLEDDNTGISQAAYQRLDGPFFRIHHEQLDSFLTDMEEDWVDQSDPNDLISHMLRILSLGRYLERGRGHDRVNAAFYRMKENYVQRDTQNMHVLHAIQFTELYLTRSPLARVVDMPVASAFETKIPLLRKWLEAVKDYFSDYDTELDSTEDEKLAGVSNSNILKFNLRTVDLMSLMEVLRHEVRHRITKTARMTYAQNELLSRLEDVLSIKFAERMRGRRSPDLGYILDALISHKKNELTTVLSSTYGASSMDAELTDRYLSQVLRVDMAEVGWHQRINDIFESLEKEIGVFIPRVTDEEVMFLDGDAASAGGEGFTFNAKVNQLLEINRELVHQYFELHGKLFSSRDRERLEETVIHLMTVDFLRMHIHLEEDFAERIHEGLSDMTQGDHRIVLENRLAHMHFSGPELWKRLQFLLRTQGRPSQVSKHREVLVTGTFPAFSLRMFDASRSKRYFPEIAKDMLGASLRGKSNLPNEIYSPVLQKQNFEKGLFRAVRYEHGMFLETELLSDSGEVVQSRARPLTGENMIFLNSLYLTNPPEEGTVILFVEGLDEEIKEHSEESVGAHYGVIRPQIYVDRAVLGNPDKALLEINHELEERRAVIQGLASIPNGRDIYSDPAHSEYARVRARVSEIAQQAHYVQQLREKTLLADRHLQDILNKFLTLQRKNILKVRSHGLDEDLYLETLRMHGVSMFKRWFHLKSSSGKHRKSYEEFVLSLDIDSPDIKDILQNLLKTPATATSFFRNAQPVSIPGLKMGEGEQGWARQMERYFAGLIEEKMARKDFSIQAQSIGSSRGQEAYSIALIVLRQLEKYADEHGLEREWINQWDIKIECFESQVPLLVQAKMGVYLISHDDMKYLQKYFPEYLEKMDVTQVGKGSFRAEMPETLKRWIRPVYVFYHYLNFPSSGKYHEYHTFGGLPNLIVLLNFLAYVTDIDLDLLAGIRFSGTLDRSYSTGVLMNEENNTMGHLDIAPPSENAVAAHVISGAKLTQMLIENVFKDRDPDDLRQMLVQNMSSLEGNWMTDLQQVASATEAIQFLERYGGSHAIEDFFKTYALGAFARSEELDPDMAVALAEIFKNARERKSIFEQIQRENQKLLETLVKDKNIFILDSALDEKSIQEFASKINQKTSYILVTEHGDTLLPDDFRQKMEGLFKNAKRLRFIHISGEITPKTFISEMQNALTEITGAPFEGQKDAIISLYQNTHASLYQALAGELAIDVLSANGHIPPVVEDRLKSLGILPDDQSDSLKLLEEVQMVQDRRKQVHAIYQRTLRAK